MTASVKQEDVLAFWFGDCGADGLAAPEVSKRWFSKDDAFDAEIRARFAPLYEAVVAGAFFASLHRAKLF